MECGILVSDGSDAIEINLESDAGEINLESDASKIILEGEVFRQLSDSLREQLAEKILVG